jgi:membrane protein implicated in regulation of membrane protease activity
VPFVAIVWIVICVLLIAVELHHLAFFAMFGAAGAAAAAVIALFLPSAIALQVIVFLLVAVVGVVAVRPKVSEHFAPHGPAAAIGGVHGGLIGARGVTLDEVGSHDGHVRILGERWLAVTIDETIPPSTPVIVTKVVGTTLTVRAVPDHLEFS